MADKVIYSGDTMPITVSWFIPSLDNPYAQSDAVISAATVRVIRNADRAVIVADEAATVDGNETIFSVPTDLTQRAGLYTAYVSAHFNDDTVLTQEVSYYVRPRG